jgi:hypothetical protein
MNEGPSAVAFSLRSSVLLFWCPRRRSLSLLLQRSSASRLELVIPPAPGVEVVHTHGIGIEVPFVGGIYWVFA